METEICKAWRLRPASGSRESLSLCFTFSVFFTQAEQILLFHLVRRTCGVRSATVTQPIYNCLRSHDATAPKRRNINRKLGKVTLLIGDHNTTLFFFFFKLNSSTTRCQPPMKKTRMRIKAANVYAATLLPDRNSVVRWRVTNARSGLCAAARLTSRLAAYRSEKTDPPHPL